VRQRVTPARPRTTDDVAGLREPPGIVLANDRFTMPRDLLDRVIHGALAGVNGAATMTVLRMLAHRAHLLDQTVPQKVEQRARRGTGLRARRVPAMHRVLEQALHLGYGATWGAIYAAIFGGERRSHVAPAVGFGVAQWAFGIAVLFPVLKIGRPPWRSRPRENAINIASHLLYAAVTAFLTEELARQPRHHVLSTRLQRPAVG
jgi:hypothetical protein